MVRMNTISVLLRRSLFATLSFSAFSSESLYAVNDEEFVFNVNILPVQRKQQVRAVPQATIGALRACIACVCGRGVQDVSMWMTTLLEIEPEDKERYNFTETDMLQTLEDFFIDVDTVESGVVGSIEVFAQIRDEMVGPSR